MRVFEEKSPVALWAGIEATINRVGDAYHDQLDYTGHYERGTADLRALAGLGIKTVRYPVLWERHQPQKDTEPDWTFAHTGLQELRQAGVTPVVGLVHHGSGPSWVSFEDETFEQGLQAYARQVALQFPWVDWYTPVNEPLTTARFCGLYGHWYPHGQSTDSFVRVLVSECKATVLAMQAIREVNPAAKLVQTEDLGKTYSTPLLRYQAELENQRRWLSIDLISGRVTPEHPLWHYLLDAGTREADLQFFQDHGAMPDLIGLNHYVTSERYLDEALEHYPAHTHGGNGIHQYADVEALRTPVSEPTGLAALLRQAWDRYRHPMAITEVHLGGPREQQARWFHQSWELACALRQEGIDIRAITAWAAFGMYGWNELCRSPRGLYEPGLFDVRSGTPRPTALARLVQQLCAGQDCAHPAIRNCPGWWEQENRLWYRVQPATKPHRLPEPDLPARPLLLLGKTGTLGAAFARLCRERDIPHVLWSRAELDLTQPDRMAEALAGLNPWAVVNATGYVRVNDAEVEPERCRLVNCTGAVALAKACAQLGMPLLSFSSDLVFDGRKGRAYTESDRVNPLNAYGRSKADAEAGILAHHPRAAVVRTSAFFGPWDEYNFIHHALRQLAEGRSFEAASDVVVSPTYVPDLVHECLDLLLDEATGIWHISNGEPFSWVQFATQAALQAGLDPSLVVPRTQKELGWPALHPHNSALQSERGLVLPTISHALTRYLDACPPFGESNREKSGFAVAAGIDA